MRKFKLGQEVMVSGKYAKASVDSAMVEEVKSAVIKHGITAISSKYECIGFDSQKKGIIVGIRSVARFRSHSPERVESGEITCVTTTTKRSVYLVATDMRGLMYVPAMMIEDCQDYAVSKEAARILAKFPDYLEEEIDDDLDLCELDDEDYDGLDDWDDEEEEL